MKKPILVAILMCWVALPVSLADNVTVHGSLGLLPAQLVTKTLEPVGTMDVWNDTKDLNIKIAPADGYLLSKVYVYISPDPAPPPEEPTEPDYGEWPYGARYKQPTADPYVLPLSFEELNFEWGHWGPLWLEDRVLTIAARVELKSTDAVPVTLTAFAMNPIREFVSLESQQTGWGDNALAMRYEVQHPKHGTFFVGGPVNGLGFQTATQQGTTGDENGGIWYFPGEYIYLTVGDVYVGFAQADQRLSPLDVFLSSDSTEPTQATQATDAAALNMARLLMSLDADGEPKGSIDISPAAAAALKIAMGDMRRIDFTRTDLVDTLIADLLVAAADLGVDLPTVSVEDATAALEQSAGGSLVRRNISKSPDYAVDKPKLDVMPVYVPAREANGSLTTVVYRDDAGEVIEERALVKPLFVTYTEEQDPNPAAGITRRGSDIITAVSRDDGATWKRFNVSHMARRSSFTLENDERFPGNCRGPQQKIVDDKILVVWTSAYARGGKPSFAIKTDDAYPYDDAYAVNDVWGVRGRQGSVNYDEDKDVGDQGIGEIPYYALWACRGVLVWEGNQDRFEGRELGEVVWFKPERLTSGRRDAFFANLGGTKNVGFGIAWQEDPGGLLPGSLKGGGDGWSGATVHKKTDIWYSYIKLVDFDLVDSNFVPTDTVHSADELAEPNEHDDHGEQPEISNRPKWLVPMSLAVRVSDNNTVNTDNLKVQLDPVTGLPLVEEVVDPDTGELIPQYIPLDGAVEEDFLATEHESGGGCSDSEDPDDEHDGSNGTGGGWGMARYAYMLPGLNLADFSGNAAVWEHYVDGDYRPADADANEEADIRWYRFINKPGVLKTVLVTPDGRPLDGDTGACRPHLTLMSGGWAILGYEETKGLGIPPEGDHDEESLDEPADRPEPDDSGKNVIYHSFRFNTPDMVSAGNVLNLPALDDGGNLIPIYYKDAAGLPTEHLRQFKTEVARRYRTLAQSKGSMGPSQTIMLATYKQGREGSGKPSDIFAIRGVVPANDKGNPYRFENLVRFDVTDPNPDANGYNRYQRKQMNMSAATVESMDPVLTASDNEGNTWNKVGKWKQYQGDLSAESFANPYSDAKGHRGFIRGDTVVFGYSFTPNWGRLGGDHMDFYVRRSFDGGQNWTTGSEEAVHTVIERDPDTGEYSEKQYTYGAGEFEPGRNVSLLKGNSHTVIDPRLVPPMGVGSTVNPQYPQDDLGAAGTFYVVFGTARVLHGLGEPLGVTDTVKEDLYYTRTTDGGTTWLQVPWVVNPDSSSPIAGETVYRWPWLAHGTSHQGHAQVRSHPSGTRLYAIWHQWSDGDEVHITPHDVGDDIWFRRIDFPSELEVVESETTP